MHDESGPAIIDRIDAYWAAHLECLLNDLREPRITVIAHGRALMAYEGVYALRACKGGLVVSAPPARVAALYKALSDREMEAAFDPKVLGEALPADAPIVIGPASLAYAARDSFVSPPNTHPTRRLTAADDHALAQLRTSCDPVEWLHSGIDPGRDPIIACFDGATIVSAASWEARGPLRHVGVITRPAYRGRGYATAVSAALTEAAFAEEGIPQWQTLVANKPSLAIGLKLGYVERYRSIAVRLK